MLAYSVKERVVPAHVSTRHANPPNINAAPFAGIFIAIYALHAEMRSMLMTHANMCVSKAQQQQPGDEFDAYESAHRDAVLLLTAGLDAHIVGLARSLLQRNVAHVDPELLRSLHKHCGGATLPLPASSSKNSPQRNTIRFSWLRDTVSGCIASQDVVAKAVEQGPEGAIDQENGFGYRPLHHAAHIGDARILQAVLDAKPDPLATTTLEQTALHIATTRGSVEVVPALIFGGVPQEAKDRKGRTALDIACYHPWADAVAERFGISASKMCAKVWGGSPTKPPPAGLNLPWPPTGAVGGGWLSPHVGDVATTGSCGFDVRTFADGFNADTFLFDYLMLQRPLLVRGALVGQSWDALRLRWGRESVLNLYGDEEMFRNEIPYGDQFGLTANITTIRMQLHYMQWLYRENSTSAGGGNGASSSNGKHNSGNGGSDKNGNQPSTPASAGYIFQPVGADSTLLDGIELPSFLDPTRTEIELQNSQFYLGPEGSGAPSHFHRAAFNVLVYGRKRWLLKPPAEAEYSTEHPKFAFDAAATSASAEYSCQQESGDVVFVPDGWSHATLNMAESIGFASEFVWGASHFEVKP